MNYPGIPSRGLGGDGSGTAGMSEQEQAIVKGVSFHPSLPDQVANATVSKMNAAMESCAGKTVVSGGVGFLLGGAFGLFMASVRRTRLTQR